MDIHRANQGLEAFRAAMESAAYDLIVLDEINMAVDFGLLKFEQVEELLMHKPKELHVILTGRNAPQQLVQMADMVTEMTEVKHHYRQGIQAQKGIEF
jgi:cob(I)alamin adenosyltransferase